MVDSEGCRKPSNSERVSMNKDEQRREDMKVLWAMVVAIGIGYILVKLQVAQRFAEWAVEGKIKFVKRRW